MTKAAYSTILMAAVLAGTGVYGQAQIKASNAGLSPGDRAFLNDLAHADVAQISLGRLAEQKGSTPDVIDFGVRMENDHTSINDQLSAVASRWNITLPAVMSAKDRMEKSRLEKLSGKAFDDAYLEQMVADHRSDVKMVRLVAETAENPAIKRFAQTLLPELEDHLRIAQGDANQAHLSAEVRPQ